MNKISIIDMDAENMLEYGVCGYKSLQRPGFPEKVAWFKDQLKEGLKIKTLITEKRGV